ncbi:MAG TPA: YgcG family protein [Steroidobacteraceae bacterium]|nr:YgcG family protein [Steroidobacteraceae bacterium]
MSLAALAQAPAASAPGLQPIPRLSARVTDLTGTLTAEQQTALEQKLAAFESAKGSQLAVLIVPTTQPEEIEQYSIRVVDQWKLGRKGVEDGALLIIAKNDHHVRIEVGRGLEGVLTDAISNRIIDETIKPDFRAGNFYGGISTAFDQMMKLVQGEPLPPPEERWQPKGSAHALHMLPALFFAVLIGSVVLRSLLGRTLGSAATGAGAGLLVWLTAHGLALAGLAALGGFLFAMLSGLARGSGWSSYARGAGIGGGWGGIGGGGFGGGGFGGGGFSGGGGGFSGGGASGSW